MKRRALQTSSNYSVNWVSAEPEEPGAEPEKAGAEPEEPAAEPEEPAAEPTHCTAAFIWRRGGKTAGTENPSVVGRS